MNDDDYDDEIFTCDECGDDLRPGEHFRCAGCQRRWLEAIAAREPAPNEPTEDMPY